MLVLPLLVERRNMILVFVPSHPFGPQQNIQISFLWLVHSFLGMVQMHLPVDSTTQ